MSMIITCLILVNRVSFNSDAVPVWFLDENRNDSFKSGKAQCEYEHIFQQKRGALRIWESFHTEHDTCG